MNGIQHILNVQLNSDFRNLILDAQYFYEDVRASPSVKVSVFAFVNEIFVWRPVFIRLLIVLCLLSLSNA